MDLQLDDKLVFISGSTQGIGNAIAEILLKEGAEVILNGRGAIEEKTDLPSRYDNTYSVSADLSSKEGIEKACKEIDDIGELDILINNMGIFSPTDFMDIPDEEWFRFFESNVMSTVRLSRHYFPKMLESDFGRIINISSEAGIRGLESMIHYSMTKGAQVVFGRGLANLTKGSGKNMTVNSVLPGPTMTEGVSRWLEEHAENQGMEKDEFIEQFFSEIEPTSLLQRFLDPYEVANVVAFLASPLSIAVNGASVRAEGGLIKSIT